MNQVILVGRITQDPKLEENRTVITLAVQRGWKNSEGVYETDFIPCILWNGVASNTCEYCKAGDIVGVKGRLQSSNNKIEIIAEKVTFISQKKGSEE